MAIKEIFTQKFPITNKKNLYLSLNVGRGGGDDIRVKI